MSNAVSWCAYDSATISVESSGVIAIPFGKPKPSATTRAEPSGVTTATIPGANSHPGKANPMLFTYALPRLSTLTSFQCSSPKAPDRSACVANVPSASCRSRACWRPETSSSRPSGSQSMQAGPNPWSGPDTTVSELPVGVTAMISWRAQSENHRRPSCQRGDSPNTMPVMMVRGSDMMAPLVRRATLTTLCRSRRTGFDMLAEGGRDEIRDPDPAQPAGGRALAAAQRRAARGRPGGLCPPERGAGGVGRNGRVGRVGRSVAGQAGHRSRRRDDRHRRAVRRGEGAPGRFLPGGVRQHRARGGVRGEDPRGGPHGGRGAPGAGPDQRGHVNRVEEILRDLAPRVLAVLVKRYGQFDQCEDAVQEALLAAALQWPRDGVPENPTGWLVTVAGRRWTEQWRSDQARRRREQTVHQLHTAAGPSVQDDELTLFLLCCHPALSVASQVALTLRAVGGLTTAEIARALLVPESTVGQRISRAKQQIRNAGTRFELPPPDQLPARVAAVRQVLYLIFNEGYTASSGPALHRVQLTAEAIRLTRQLNARRPGDGETAGLLALMLSTDARRDARTAPDGSLVPLEEQDRRRWDADAIAEGTALVEATLATAEVGPFQLQAAIAAVHDQAGTAAETDWPQILVLYDLLVTVAPGPMATP